MAIDDFFTRQHFIYNRDFYSHHSIIFLLNGLNLKNNPLFDTFKHTSFDKTYINNLSSLFSFLNFGLSSTSEYLKPENEVFLNFLKMDRSTFTFLQHNNDLQFTYKLKFGDDFLFHQYFHQLVETTIGTTLKSNPESLRLYPTLNEFVKQYNTKNFSSKIKELFSKFLSKQIISNDEALSISNYLLSQNNYMKILCFKDSFTEQEIKDIKIFINKSDKFFNYIKHAIFESSLEFVSDIKRQEKTERSFKKKQLSLDTAMALSTFFLTAIKDTPRAPTIYQRLNEFAIKNNFNSQEEKNYHQFLNNLYTSLYEDNKGFLGKKYLNSNDESHWFNHQQKFFTALSDLKIKSLLPQEYFLSVKNQMEKNLIEKFANVNSSENLNILKNVHEILRESRLEIKLNESQITNSTNAKRESYKLKKI